jgi:hypothetical protein
MNSLAGFRTFHTEDVDFGRMETRRVHNDDWNRTRDTEYDLQISKILSKLIVFFISTRFVHVTRSTDKQNETSAKRRATLSTRLERAEEPSDESKSSKTFPPNCACLDDTRELFLRSLFVPLFM